MSFVRHVPRFHRGALLFAAIASTHCSGSLRTDAGSQNATLPSICPDNQCDGSTLPPRSNTDANTTPDTNSDGRTSDDATADTSSDVLIADAVDVVSDLGPDTSDAMDASTDAVDVVAEVGPDAADVQVDVTPDVVVDVVPIDAGPPTIAINEVRVGMLDFVELVNTGTTPSELGGVALTIASRTRPDGGTIDAGDEAGVDAATNSEAGTTAMPDLSVALRFPRPTVLNPGQHLLVMTGRTGSTNGQQTSCIPGGGPPRCYHAPFSVMGGDTVLALTESGSVLAQFVYPTSGVPAGLTWGRLPNGTGAPTINLATPGEENRYPIVINEISGSSPDYVELYNLAPVPLDLGGLRVADSNGTVGVNEVPKLSEAVQFPAGTMLAPASWLLVLAESMPPAGNPEQTNCAPTPATRCFLAAFGISSSRGESIWLVAPSGAVLSQVTLPPMVAGGASWGAVPDGLGTYTMGPQTPSLANR